MTLHYSLSYSDWLDYYDALTPHDFVKPTQYYFSVFGINGLLLTFAYLSFSDFDQIALGIIAIYFAVVNLCATIPHTKFRKKAIKDQADTKSDYTIDLEIGDTGLTETAFGIVSFCPWSSVTRIQKFKGLIIVHLSGGLYGIIPNSALKSINLSQEDFISLLESKKHTEQGAAANRASRGG